MTELSIRTSQPLKILIYLFTDVHWHSFQTQCNKDAKDSNQRTSLHIAVSQKHKRTVELLLSSGIPQGSVCVCGGGESGGRGGTCSLVPWNKWLSCPLLHKIKILIFYVPWFPKLPWSPCSPHFRLLFPINALVPLFPETPGMTHLLHYVFIKQVRETYQKIFLFFFSFFFFFADGQIICALTESIHLPNETLVGVEKHNFHVFRVI